MPDTLLNVDEIVSPTQVGVGRKLLVTVPRAFTDRRLYLFLDTQSTGDFVLFTRVLTLDNGTPVDSFPAHLFSNTNGTLATNRSMMNCFSVGGSAVGDSLILQLTKPFNTTIPSVVMQPFRVQSTITHVAWEIESFAGQLTGFRAYLACVSGQS